MLTCLSRNKSKNGCIGNIKLKIIIQSIA